MTRAAGGQFARGNPGKPRGSRNKATQAVEKILDGEADGLTRKAIELALAGDVPALRICMDRLVPPRKDRAIMFDLPEVKTSDDIASAGRGLLAAVASGTVTPGEAGEVMRLLDGLARTIEVSELERRLRALEEGMPR